MGEGGGAAIHAVCAAIQDALRGAGGGVVTDSHNPPERVYRLMENPDESRARVEVVSR
jgi:2-furoyl-CoA dehydrogenase large subunit